MTSPDESPEIIMFVRHGEKPGDGGPPHGVNTLGEVDEHSLSVRGWTRAGALAGLFAHAPSRAHPHVTTPERIFATRPTSEVKSKREMDTASPTARRLSLHVDDRHTRGEEAELTQEVLGSHEATLIVWHHGSMAKLLGHFPVVNRKDVPGEWPEERFDLIWILVREPGPELSYRFVVVPQMLLADDSEVT
jgi:hypothetical protein